MLVTTSLKSPPFPIATLSLLFSCIYADTRIVYSKKIGFMNFMMRLLYDMPEGKTALKKDNPIIP